MQDTKTVIKRDSVEIDYCFSCFMPGEKLDCLFCSTNAPPMEKRSRLVLLLPNEPALFPIFEFLSFIIKAGNVIVGVYIMVHPILHCCV